MHESSTKYSCRAKAVRYNQSIKKRCWKPVNTMTINQQYDNELSFLRFDQFNMEKDNENHCFNNIYQMMDQS